MARTAYAALAAALALGLGAPAARADFGASSFKAEVQDSGGHLVTQAGSHPFSGVTDFQLNTSDPFGTVPDENVRNIRVDVPAGLISNPEATPKCATADFPSCNAKTQIGEVTLFVAGLPNGPFPVYNMAPAQGQVSDFAFDASGIGLLPRTDIIGGVRPTDYGLFFTISDVPQSVPVTGSDLTFYGIPANRNGGGGTPTPFITLPTFCGPSQTSTLTLKSWQGTTAVANDTTPTGATGCDQLLFSPSITVTPQTTQQDTPTGATVDLHVPTADDPTTHLSPSHVRDAVVTLPPGLTINPPSATGLEACTDAQFAKGTTNAIACPDASKVGTASIATPVLPQPLTGNVYIGQPQPGKLFRLFVDAEGSGVIVRLEGQVTPDPNTGQLTTTFAETPQTPFSDFVLTFNGGPNATLANPLACGTATTTSSITPWSGQPAATPSSAYTVDADGHGASCPAPPFALGFAAGTQNPLAGSFSPFTLTVSRSDGQQYLAKLAVQEPPGLLGMISNVPLCGDADAAAGTCPDATRVGTSTVSSGAGPAPFTLQGPVYLTGPYKGAPFGLAIVVHALAGPFDLGTVIVRSAIRVDPTDSHLVIDADPLPTILQGVPLRLRTVAVAIDRDQFIFNPTSCDPHVIGATLTSTDGTVQQASAPFQATGCAGLPFAPKLTATSSARTSQTLGAGLSVNLTQGRGESNVKSVSVNLPKQFGARLDTVSLACPVAKFNADPKTCPDGARVGTARAATPLLHDPLSGGVYLVAPGGGKLPVLEAVLQGSGITVDLVGSIDLSNGIKSTFAAVPDVPITQFALDLPAGVHSALAATGDLCAGALVAPTAIVSQSGKTVQQQTPLVIPDCPIKIVSAKVKGRKALLTVRVPAAGRLTVSGKALKTVRRSVRAGRVKITDPLTKRAVRKLVALRKRHRKLRVPITASFAPARGTIAIKSKASKKLAFK